MAVHGAVTAAGLSRQLLLVTAAPPVGELIVLLPVNTILLTEEPLEVPAHTKSTFRKMKKKTEPQKAAQSVVQQTRGLCV